MGLDSAVKVHLRQHTPRAFNYFKSLSELYSQRPYDACIIDMNVELYRKPPHISKGLDWAEYVFKARIQSPPGTVAVLLFDAPARVPHTKDMTHLTRSQGTKRKKIVPLSADTKFGDNIDLPDWDRVTSTKTILPALWSYLIDALKRIAARHVDFNKTFFVDAPLSPKHGLLSPYMDGAIHCIHRAPGETRNGPIHKFGEGDLKTLAWADCLKTDWKLNHILIWSTDLDNVAIFSRPQYVNTDLIGNTVGRDNMNQVVSKKASQRHEYEVINLGQIAMDLGKYSALFRSVLIMGKTDFNESVDRITTDRMIKTFFCLKKENVLLDPIKILEEHSVYFKFRGMCFSKGFGNTPRRKTMPFAASHMVTSYLSRCRWIRDYWLGVEQKLGGPLPGPGWEAPKQEHDLGVYQGRVRLVPVGFKMPEKKKSKK